MESERREFFDEIVKFFGDLKNIRVKKNEFINTTLELVGVFISSRKDVDEIVKPMINFLKTNHQKIESRNDLLFKNFEAKTGAIRLLLNYISSIWQDVEQEDKTIIWDWMEYFLEFYNTRKNNFDMYYFK